MPRLQKQGVTLNLRPTISDRAGLVSCNAMAGEMHWIHFQAPFGMSGDLTTYVYCSWLL
jgi:hypothetical protein